MNTHSSNSLPPKPLDRFPMVFPRMDSRPPCCRAQRTRLHVPVLVLRKAMGEEPGVARHLETCRFNGGISWDFRLVNVLFWGCWPSLSSILWKSYPKYLGDVQVGHLPNPGRVVQPTIYLPEIYIAIAQAIPFHIQDPRSMVPNIYTFSTW